MYALVVWMNASRPRLFTPLRASSTAVPWTLFLGFRTSRGAAGNRLTYFARPSNVLLQARVGVLDESKTGFQRLKKDPETASETSQWPSHKDEEDQPEQSEAGIIGHCRVSFVRLS